MAINRITIPSGFPKSLIVSFCNCVDKTNGTRGLEVVPKKFSRVRVGWVFLKWHNKAYKASLKIDTKGTKKFTFHVRS